MPTLTLHGPTSDPSIEVPTVPIPAPPGTRVAPRPVVPAPAPQPVKVRRRRGRALAWLTFFAMAGAATGGALAYYGVELPVERTARRPGMRQALTTIRGVGDYTTAPVEESVTVTFPVEDECILVLICDGGGEFSYGVTGTIDARVPMAVVRGSNVVIRRGSIGVLVPGAELGDPVVDRDSIEELDSPDWFDDTYDSSVSEREIVAIAADEIASRADDGELTREAQRAVRRLLVHRLHAAGFEHVRVEFA